MRLVHLSRGRLVAGDVMLAQKLALELEEKAALRAGRDRCRSPSPVEPRRIADPADQPPAAPCVLT